MYILYRRFFFLVSILFLSSVPGGCGDDDAGSVSGECEAVDCSGHGRCAVVGSGDGAQAVCICDAGYRADGLDCVEIVSGAECEAVDCSGHGRCVVADGDPKFPVCLCDEGYVLAGTTTCVDAGGGLNCGPGTHPEGNQCLPNDQSRPDGFCVPQVLSTNGVVPVEQFSLTGNNAVRATVLDWTGDHYLAVMLGTGSAGLWSRTITPGGQVGDRVALLGGGDLPEIRYKALIGTSRCGANYCGYVGDLRDEPGLAFVVDASGNFVASASLPAGMVVGIAGGDDRAFVVLQNGFVPLDPDGTVGTLTPFGDGSRTTVAVARYGDGADIVTVEVPEYGQWMSDPKISGWDTSGSRIFGPEDVFGGLAAAVTWAPLRIESTPAGYLFLGLTENGAYSEAFDDQGHSQGVWYLAPVRSVRSVGVNDAFALYLGDGPTFQFGDILGRPVTDAGGRPLFVDHVDGIEPRDVGAAGENCVIAESGQIEGVLVPWTDTGLNGHVTLVRFGCE